MNASEYHSMTSTAGFAELANHYFVRLTGEDRQSFFHNFCTAEIKKLQPGEIAEAFVLNPKGKIIRLVHAMAGENELMLVGHGGGAGDLIEHLDKYLIRERVVMSDETATLGAIFVCGDLARERLGSAFSRQSDSSEIPESSEISRLSEIPERNFSGPGTIADVAVTIWNVELAGYGFLLVCDQSDIAALKTALADIGIAECKAVTMDAIRVEQKTPWFGIDVDDSRLPQELQRDEQAISFNKGCYLGQETVARIDARGRVNKLFVQLKFSSDGLPTETSPSPGDELTLDGSAVGQLTSVAWSPRYECFLGLGYVRRLAADTDTVLGDWTVI